MIGESDKQQCAWLTALGAKWTAEGGTEDLLSLVQTAGGSCTTSRALDESLAADLVEAVNSLDECSRREEDVHVQGFPDCVVVDHPRDDLDLCTFVTGLHRESLLGMPGDELQERVRLGLQRCVPQAMRTQRITRIKHGDDTFKVCPLPS